MNKYLFINVLGFVKIEKNVVVLLILWVSAILLVNPLGDFPLNDDWAYGKVVEHWLKDGKFQLINWGEMTLFSHVIHGLVITKVFGFSYTTLRISTLIISFVGILGVYRLGNICGLNSRASFILSFLVLANPIFLSLSFSYMTDVPFMTIVVWSIYFFIKYNKERATISLFLATVLCIWAMLSRQLAIVIPFSWFFAQLFSPKVDRVSFIRAIVPLVSVIIAYLSFHSILDELGLLPNTYGSKLDYLKELILNPDLRFLRNTVGYVLLFTAYIGLFLSPLLFFLKGNFFSRKDRLFIVAYSLAMTLSFALMNKLIPSIDNVFIDFGVGPNTMEDFAGNFRDAPYGGKAPVILKSLLTLVGFFSGGVIIVAFKNWLIQVHKGLLFNEGFILMIIACYMGPFMITGYYDRYLIIVFPLMGVFLFNSLTVHKGRMYLASITLIGTFLFFSVAATHDYLSWNRKRWEVIYLALENEIPAISLGAGVEFQCLYFFDNDNPQWYLRPEPEYKITFRPQENHTILNEVEYSRWLPGENSIVLTKKAGNHNE